MQRCLLDVRDGRRSESDPEQHSRYLVAEARKLGIDLRVDENLERWLNPAGFISYKEESLVALLTAEEMT